MNAVRTDFSGLVLAEGRYEVREEIGQGSMGQVFRAFDARLESEVVIKVPTTTRLTNKEFRRRFMLESRMLTKLTHPSIVRILDVGEHENVPYYVMPCIDGGDLESRLRSKEGRRKRLSPQSLAKWLKGVAAALDFVHSKGYVHRDVKPGNILFDQHGHAYLSDFGLSKVMEEADKHDSSGMTAANAVVGTPNYVAPELVLGEEYDGRADQYSLAITVYEALTGRPPLEGPTPSATMVNQTAKHPKPLNEVVSKVPAALSAAVKKALAKKPEKRFDNCAEFADAVLKSLGAGSSGSGSRPRWVVVKTTKGKNGRIKCPGCGELHKLGQVHAGKRGSCIHCGCKLLIGKQLRELKLIELRETTAEAAAALGGEASAQSGDEMVLGMRVSHKAGMILASVAALIVIIAAVIIGQQAATFDDRSDKEPAYTSREGG